MDRNCAYHLVVGGLSSARLLEPLRTLRRGSRTRVATDQADKACDSNRHCACLLVVDGHSSARVIDNARNGDPMIDETDGRSRRDGMSCI